MAGVVVKWSSAVSFTNGVKSYPWLASPCMLQSLFDFPISLVSFEDDGVDTGMARDFEVGVGMTCILEGKMAVCLTKLDDLSWY